MLILPDAAEVHVWGATLAWTDNALAQGYAMLNVEEQQRADRFLVAPARCQYIAATVTLRHVLAQYVGCSVQELQFTRGPQGKPYIKNSSLQFNLSHSHEQALIAVTARHEVGVDIEYHARDSAFNLEELAQRFFAPAEYQQLMQLATQHRQRAFFKIWTQKEAFIKATGQGLSFGLDNFVVDIAGEQMDCLLTMHGSAKLARQWSVGSIALAEQDYTAALAMQGVVGHIKRRQWLQSGNYT